MTRSLERALAALAVAGLGALSAGCTQQSQTVTLRSLESSGALSFLCLGLDYGPRNLDDCPDANPVDGEERHLYSLVTQATRGEVALVDLTAGSVVDDEPTVPGFNFLTVGAEPRAIVSTPGSVASFVGVAEVGKEGIFALPSSCIGPRADGEPLRDLTMWPACRLPSAPGEMAILVDHPVDTDGDPATPSVSQCQPSVPTATPEEIESRQCPADLSTETQSPGRRLLAVTLPESGQLAILDAQAVLDREPGSFDACPIERLIQLRADVPKSPPQQVLPADLAALGGSRPEGNPYEAPDAYQPVPAGLSVVDDPRTGEERLYLGDQSSPVIHVLDAKVPCRLTETEPLLPMSFVEPARTVVTRKLAVSPLTTDGKRYLYAIDENDAGSVMVFDVSQGSTDRTPLLRPRSALLTYEAPDRIKFSGVPAKDVTFAFRDRIEPDPSTGNQQVGVFCDPDPTIDASSPPAQYRPSADRSSGAAPARLRGVFGFVALSSGSISVIDVEDFDGKCRRPIVANQSSTPDHRGCAGDQDGINFFTVDPTNPNARATVTNEASCNLVEPHRARSASFVLNDEDNGVRAPALRALPRLVSDVGRALPNDVSAEGRRNPKLLGVKFSGDWMAQVYVGSALYESTSLDNPLDINPETAEQNSVVLNTTDPRTYAPQETMNLTFEGSLFGEGTSAQLVRRGGALTLKTGVALCKYGVEDVDVARARGVELGVAAADRDVFASNHADYVRITSDLVDADDAYWSGAGAACGGFLQCRAEFGTRSAPRDERDLQILEASANTLTLAARRGTAEEKAALEERIACCFPQLLSYEVRAGNAWVLRGSVSGYRHDIKAADDTFRCVIDDDPLRSRQRARAYEVSCDPSSIACVGSDGAPRSIGLAATDPSDPARDVACVIRDPREDVTTVGDPCVFDGLNSTFVVYRGQEPSQRDWQFQWDVIGGFSPLFVSLAASRDPNSNPQSMVFSKELGDLIVADGASKGIVRIDLSTFTTQYYF